MRTFTPFLQRSTAVALSVSMVPGAAQAQQLSRHSQFVQNPFLVNPAFAGTELGTFASLSHR